MAKPRDLDAFLAVARTGNLTHAARQLGLTQPSVTKRIFNLENDVGSALFERQRRGMRLTAAGQLFHEHAARIEREYANAREKITALGGAGLDVLRVGAGPVFHLNYVAPAFKALKNEYPALMIHLLADANVRTIPMLIDHRLDVVFGTISTDLTDAGILTQEMTRVEHGIVLAADDRFAKEPSIDPDYLRDREWVVYTEDPETERNIETYLLPLLKIKPQVSVRTSSFTTGLQMVTKNRFVMSAPLQLAPTIESHGLVIRPTTPRMPVRAAGLHVRQSSANIAVIKRLLEYFGNGSNGAGSPSAKGVQPISGPPIPGPVR